MALLANNAYYTMSGQATMQGCGDLQKLQAGGAELGSTAAKLPETAAWLGWAHEILGMKPLKPRPPTGREEALVEEVTTRTGVSSGVPLPLAMFAAAATGALPATAGPRSLRATVGPLIRVNFSSDVLAYDVIGSDGTPLLRGDSGAAIFCDGRWWTAHDGLTLESHRQV